MGLERLVRVLQAKQSNYDIDLFSALISQISSKSGIEYGSNERTDIAQRVIADHLRAVSFSIAEGQLPSNTGPGYVIRRILRRAIRYGYSYLKMDSAWIGAMVTNLADQMGKSFPELSSQKELITRVITEEEENFLKTLGKGIQRINDLISKQGSISGEDAFELYDTFGFPFDLSTLIAAEHSIEINEEEFKQAMSRQKERSRAAASSDKGDWVELNEEVTEGFVGYDDLSIEAQLVRYRQVEEKKKTFYELVFNRTPFYPEGGGQVGDKGAAVIDGQSIPIWNTKKENDQILHYTNYLPENLNGTWTLEVKEGLRSEAAKNHSATHLLHHALRSVLGEHVEQKGSLVHPDYLRFDFSHFSKMTEEELVKVSEIMNNMVDGGIDYLRGAGGGIPKHVFADDDFNIVREHLVWGTSCSKTSDCL